ncbi:hypothetical protein LPTSP4_17050 [Leptospira ryugenii]|uniref:Outer membrane protein beta-barrel domain protein n=1 Tax=Leptospira ryugenii TaxID=1917863 RepID=A0A2P2DZW7_9LEPT|nr:hypothetical protein [Leptospira ryugenii]GBF50181.1 hypothetical protein LPTSP4_17050 [Leptospira ryugenii]
MNLYPLFRSIIKLLFLIVIFSLPSQLQLKASTSAFQTKQWLVELQGGSLVSKVSDDASPERFTNLFFLYDVVPLLNSPNIERKNLGLSKSIDYQESQIQNFNARLGVEYAILPWLGLGGSLTRSNTVVTNVLPGDYLILASFGIPIPNPRDDSPELSNYATFISRTLNASITSKELELSLHLPLGNFDFYTRGGLGQIWEGGRGRKESVSIGTRYVYEQILVSLEVYRSSLFSDLGRTDFLKEEGIRIGLGFRILPH